MKLMQILFFLIFLNGMIYIFGVAGSFGSSPEIGIEPGEISEGSENGWAIPSRGGGITGVLEMLGFSGVAAIGVGVATGIVSRLFGVSPFTTLSYGIIVGLFTNTILTTWGLTGSISTSLGEFAYVFDAFLLLLYTALGFVIIYTVVQAGIGGGKAYD